MTVFHPFSTVGDLGLPVFSTCLQAKFFHRVITVVQSTSNPSLLAFYPSQLISYPSQLTSYPSQLATNPYLQEVLLAYQFQFTNSFVLVLQFH